MKFFIFCHTLQKPASPLFRIHVQVAYIGHIFDLYILVIVSPVRSTYGGYYGLVVVPPPRPQTLHRSYDNLKNPYRIA